MQIWAESTNRSDGYSSLMRKRDILRQRDITPEALTLQHQENWQNFQTMYALYTQEFELWANQPQHAERLRNALAREKTDGISIEPPSQTVPTFD